jgi:hypothetical protein
MSYYLVKGSKCYMQSAIASAAPFTNVTNASPPEFSATAHGYSNGDEVLLSLEAWEMFHDGVFRVSSVAANTFQITGYDTTDTNTFPQGSDSGNAYKLTFGTLIGQVLDIQSSGGEITYQELSPYDKTRGIKLPEGTSAGSVEMVLGYDGGLASQQALLTASRARARRAFKFLLAGPSYAYFYGTVFAAEQPTFEGVLRRRVAVTMDGIFSSFTS